MRQRRANILVTCTKRKTVVPPNRLRLRCVGRGKPLDVARKWSERLGRSSAKKLPATDLYAGDHWKIATELPGLTEQVSVSTDLWVISAGYGLVPASAELSPYSVTFSDGDPDSVSNRLVGVGREEAPREWWKALSGCPGPVAGQPQCIEDIAAKSPQTPILLIASPKYLSAVEEDLVRAIRCLSKPNRLIIISAGGRGRGALADNTIACSAEHQKALGGALMSLNVRVARWLIAEVAERPWTVETFQEALTHLPKSDGANVLPKRLPVTDEEVCRYIDAVFQNETGLRHSTLLRRYRDAGFACEQKRFSRLFKEVEARYG